MVGTRYWEQREAPRGLERHPEAQRIAIRIWLPNWGSQKKKAKPNKIGRAGDYTILLFAKLVCRLGIHFKF